MIDAGTNAPTNSGTAANAGCDTACAPYEPCVRLCSSGAARSCLTTCLNYTTGDIDCWHAPCSGCPCLRRTTAGGLRTPSAVDSERLIKIGLVVMGAALPFLSLCALICPELAARRRIAHVA